ncbi:MAG TPA: hypothetical protein VIS76_08030 [Pseudomonadales bacterium]
MILTLLVACCPAALADSLPGVDNAERARTNYILKCQGCHGPNAEGSHIAQVPRMQGFAGNFLRVPGGREFMVQVPGTATAALSDPALAELLNWLLPTISKVEMPADFAPYSTEEVARLRQSPAIDVGERRAALIDALGMQGITEPDS